MAIQGILNKNYCDSIPMLKQSNAFFLIIIFKFEFDPSQLARVKMQPICVGNVITHFVVGIHDGSKTKDSWQPCKM